jgi:hypothetical protein
VTASLSDRTPTSRVAYSTGASRDNVTCAQAYHIGNGSEVRWLDSELFSGRRVKWMVVLAASFGEGQPYRLDPDRVARALAGRATVAAIGRPQLNQLLSRELGRELAVPVGGARFFRTGLVLHDDPALHPAVNAGSAALDSLAAFGEFAAEAMNPANDPVEQVRTLKRELVDVRRSLARQRDASSSASSAGGQMFPTLYRDPTDQFTYDLHAMYLRLTAADERARDAHPLVYGLGSQFVDSVTELVRSGLVSRERVLRVCALVASGQGNKIKDQHRLRTNEHGTSNPVVREDGAVAWRCPVQNNTPAAARLHYWLQDGGVPELSLLVRHDDPKIV